MKVILGKEETKDAVILRKPHTLNLSQQERAHEKQGRRDFRKLFYVPLENSYNKNISVR